MRTEIQLLKFIWENKGKASWLRILKELRFFSPDYCRFICEGLLKNKFIKFSEGRYEITGLGKKELVKLGLIEKVPEEKIKKIVKPIKPRKPKRKTVVKKEIKKTTIAELSGLSPKLIEALKKKGFRTLEDIAIASVVKLEGVGGLTLGKAAKIINKARERLKKAGKGELWEG